MVHLLEAFTERELASTPLQGHALFVHGTAVNQDGRSSSLTVRRAHLQCVLSLPMTLNPRC